MKTLSELKKDLHKGRKVELIKFMERRIVPVGELVDIGVPEKLKGIREVCRTQTNGVYFFNGELKSFFDFPKAADLEYEYDIFKCTVWAEIKNGERVVWQQRTYRIHY